MQCFSQPGLLVQEAMDDMAATASDLAGLVDLSPDDIGAVLLPSGGHAYGSGGDPTLVEDAAQQARAAMEQLEAQASTQHWQQALACAGHLQAAIGALQEQCLQVVAALGAAGGAAGEQHIAAVDQFF